MNQAERVWTDPATGERHCDPMTLADNWLERYAPSGGDDADDLAAVEEYFQWCEAEAMTGDLFAVEAVTP